MLTQARLKELLHYNPDTGIFTWASAPNLSIVIGTEAGTGHEGYIRIKLDGKSYLAHRLAFLYVDGYMPERQVDHKFGNTEDNRYRELRPVTQMCNSQNCKLTTRSMSD
jgi:hypothetical protein